MPEICSMRYKTNLVQINKTEQAILKKSFMHRNLRVPRVDAND